MNIKIQILKLLQRLFLPWSLTRFLFILIGSAVFYQAVMDGLWIGIIFGSYFILTGLFAWGCAGGHCQLPAPSDNISNHIEFKEIKK